MTPNSTTTHKGALSPSGIRRNFGLECLVSDQVILSFNKQALGLSLLNQNLIIIREGMPSLMRLWVVLHEIAHYALFHVGWAPGKETLSNPNLSAIHQAMLAKNEIEADVVAETVMVLLGFEHAERLIDFEGGLEVFGALRVFRYRIAYESYFMPGAFDEYQLAWAAKRIYQALTGTKPFILTKKEENKKP